MPKLRRRVRERQRSRLDEDMYDENRAVGRCAMVPVEKAWMFPGPGTNLAAAEDPAED